MTAPVGPPVRLLKGSQANYKGPGTIVVAAPGSPPPTFVAAGGIFTNSWDASWRSVGWTDTGFDFTSTPTFTDIEGAESLIPFDTVKTKEVVDLKFTMLQTSKANIATALGGGTWTETGATDAQVSTFHPPGLLHDEFMVGWVAEQLDMSLVAPRTVQTGATTFAFAKVGTRTLVACNFRVLFPEDGSDYYNVFTAGTRWD